MRFGCRIFAGVFVFTGVIASVSAQGDPVLNRMRKDLYYLASKECEGRGVDTAGLEKAAKYIANQFQAAGLKPGGKNGSWYQPFTVTRPGKLKKGNKLVLHGPQGQKIELKKGVHFQVLGFSGRGKVTAPIVFAGYGATAPRIKYDDYKGIDAKGKVVIVIRRVPRYGKPLAPFDGNNMRQHAALINKITNAELHKAAAVLLVNDVSVGKDNLMRFSELRGSSGSIPALHVKRAVVDKLLRSSMVSGLLDTEKAISADLKPRSQALKGWKATVVANVEAKPATVKNVLGVIKGSGSLADEIVVVGAHYDHLGYGESGSLERKKTERAKIHFGADDNASGTTAVIELARRFGKKNRGARRTIVFMTYSAEEKGLLGSKYYCNKEPLFPLKNTTAMVNLDMIGRMQIDKKTKKGIVRVQGTGTAKSFDGLIENLNKRYDFQLRKTKSGLGPSDHDSFYRKKIPVFFIWTGIHKNYHRPSDTPDLINYSGLQRITNLTEEVIEHLVTREKRPQYVLVRGGGGFGPRNFPKIGIGPSYDSKKKGVLVDTVRAGGPAAKAGIKPGDVITAVNKKPVANLRMYMFTISRYKSGQVISLTVQRGKKEIVLKVTPE